MKTTNVLIALSFMAVSVCSHAQDALPKQIKAGKERVKARKEIRLPEIDGYNLLKCDFHIHTIFSDGIVWPTLRIQEAWEEGLDAIAITDHIEGQPARPGVEKGNHNYSFDLAKEEADRREIILIKGGEITRSMPPGHLNALFVKDVNALYQKGWLNGIEVFNEFEWYPVALNWVNEKNLTLLCNTDVHDVIERLYDFRTTSHRPMTLVLSKDRTEEGIREALFDRRTLIWFYDTLMGKEDLLQKFFEASVEMKPVHHSTPERSYRSIVNHTDVPFFLRKTDKNANGYPETIKIPAGETILVIQPKANSNQSVSYLVENMIISPEKRLEVRLF